MKKTNDENDRNDGIYGKNYLGDCLKVMKSFLPGTFRTILTDPPYGIGKDYKGVPEDARPSVEYWKQMYRVLDRNGSLHMTMSNRHLPFWLDVARLAGFNYRHLSIYHNTTRRAGNMNGQFAYVWEPLISFTKGSFKFRKRMFLDYFPHKGKKYTKHQTEKNLWPWLEFMDHLPDGPVLDPFAGVGTTAVAGMLTGHKVTTIDMSPEYVDLTVRRLESVKKEYEGLNSDVEFPVLNKIPEELKSKLSFFHPEILYKNKSKRKK